MSNFTPKEIAASKAGALVKIREILDKEDIEAQFKDRSGDYHSAEKFIVSWSGNNIGIPSEFSICKTDSFYQGYSGFKAIYCVASLFHQKQLKGFSSIELALITIGMRLTKKADRPEFFQKYAVKYNERIKKQQLCSNRPESTSSEPSGGL